MFKQFYQTESIARSSRPEVFCKTGYFKNFAKFTEKSPVPESLFNKVADLKPEMYQKRNSYTGVFL